VPLDGTGRLQLIEIPGCLVLGACRPGSRPLEICTSGAFVSNPLGCRLKIVFLGGLRPRLYALGGGFSFGVDRVAIYVHS
jgi:hypothetical protein